MPDSVTRFLEELRNEGGLKGSDIANITDGTHFDAHGSGESTLTQRLTTAFRQAAAAIKRAKLVK